MRIMIPFTRRLGQPLLLLVRMVFILVLMAFTRWLFYFFNIQSFDHLNFIELKRLMILGVRYDLSAMAYFNLPYIFFMMIPFAFRHHRFYEKFLNSLFVFTNSILILLNLIDIVFFRYITKRTTTELHEFFFNEAENTGLLISQFLIDFWYMFLIFFLLLYLIIRFTLHFISQNPSPVRRFRWYLVQTMWFVFFGLVTVVSARGGFQLKPIGLLSAAQYTESRNIPLLINTPFSILKTSASKSIQEKKYFSEEELTKLFTPEHAVWQNDSSLIPTLHEGHNVVVLILESLGSQYVGYYHERAETLTPFLDSLLDHSFVFRGYANGKRSIEALPSIFAGIPSLMPADYPSSPYINNTIEGLGTVLKSKGYTTAFFHGGNNGTMGFDLFSSLAGFDHYFGRNEYGNDLDFDGQWGIYDEPFLAYSARQMNSFNQPFAAGIFTLSSHHPYHLPEQYKSSFPHAENEMEATFCYLDQSLKRFFDQIQTYPWFQNTIFIFTADHTPEKSNLSGRNFYEGLYEIPLAVYIPGSSPLPEVKMTTAQHIDIIPTLCALLNVQQPVFSFGRNLFQQDGDPYVLNYMSGIYKFKRNDTLLLTNGDKVLELYDLQSDPGLGKNLAENDSFENDPLFLFSRAVIQQYNNRMIQNKLYPLPNQNQISEKQ